MQKEKLTDTAGLFRWLWRTWKGYRLQTFLNAAVGILSVLADLSFVYITKLCVDIATGVSTHTTLHGAFLLLGLVILLQLGLGIASRWIRALLGVKAQNHLRRTLFATLLRSDWKGLKRFHTGNLLNRIERDVTDVISFLTESLPTFLSTCLQFLGAFLFLFLMDSTLACIIVVILPFFVLASKLYVRRMRRLTHEVRDTESKVQSHIQESLQHSLVIKTLQRTTTATGRLHDIQRRLHRQVIRKTGYSTLSSGLLNFGFAAGYLVTFVWGTTSLQQGHITYGALIAFVQLVGQIQGPVRTLTKFIPIFIGVFTASERLMELEAIPAEAAEHDPTLPAPVGIRLQHVSYAYAPGARQLFTDFSFSFPPGSVTAILGETGAGKTTLIRLLLRLLQPTAGTIGLYTPADPATLHPCTRSHFAYVPQGNTLLSGTIRDNLLLGNPQATEQQMWQALECASADFVRTLPDGLDAPCGEMGDGLSEGQAQRIAIARTLLRPAAIYLFDEATSALDSATERRVVANIVRHKQGHTLLFITHRPEVIKYCTQQLVLTKGKR
ncbi:MAG: ABC transporter ATP-binding protein [Alloprevotella sp.]